MWPKFLLQRLDSPDLTITVLGMIDSWSLFARALIIPDETASTCFDRAQRGWIACYGAPDRISHDAASAFRGKLWGENWVATEQ